MAEGGSEGRARKPSARCENDQGADFGLLPVDVEAHAAGPSTAVPAHVRDRHPSGPDAGWAGLPLPEAGAPISSLAAGASAFEPAAAVIRRAPLSNDLADPGAVRSGGIGRRR